MKDFSYQSYRQMIDYIRVNLPLMDFNYVTNQEKYFVIRHDVEYSVERALKLALIEHEMGISTSYCFQLRNNNYNVLSDRNIELVKRIHHMGHKIGLHVHTDAFFKDPIGGLALYIRKDADTLIDYFELGVDRFSVHRPAASILKSYVYVPGLINLNDRAFFTYCEGDPKGQSLEVTYLADSNHKWKYGNPLDIDFNECYRLQLNCHPDSWSESGNDNLNNFLGIIQEKKNETVESLKNEVKNFPEQIS